MAYRPTERTEKRKAQAREAIVSAALDQLADGGYASATVQVVAARAGVATGTVYRHFPSKEEPFEAVVTARLRDLIDGARGLAGDPDPGQAFFGFLARFRHEVAAKRDLPDAIAVPGSLQDDLRAALDVLLRRAQQAGAVRADITTPDLMELLKGLLVAINDRPPGTVDAGRADRLLTVVFDGLRRRDDAAGPG
jgi:AcrR family transcriptional regulator